MKSREELIKDNIELERSAMMYKKGLHLAKAFIYSHAADPDLTSEMIKNYSAFTKFLSDNLLEEI